MSRLPRLVRGCDLKSLPLTPMDGFLLSRVDAAATEEELSLMTGFPTHRVAEMLDRLAAMGAVEFADRAVDATGSQTRLRAAFARDDSPPELAKATTPSPQRERPLTPPDVLQLRRQALARKLSGSHAAAPSAPDAQAPSVTPARRPTAPDPGMLRRASDAIQALTESAAAEARAAAARAALERGKAAIASKDFTTAVDAYRRAAALAPDDTAVQALCADAIQRARAALADSQWRQAILDEREERWEEAALAYSRVCVGRPEDALAHERVANAALRAGATRRAVEYARKAIELDPKSALFRVTLARAYLAAGFDTSAQNELDRALDLAPDDAKIQALVARVITLGRRTGKAV